MEDNASSTPSPLLLERPFLKTSKIKIDVDKGTLTIEFDGETTKFNIFEEIKNPIKDQALSSINLVNMFVQEHLGSKVANDAAMKGKNILRHNIKSKLTKERSSTIDKALKGKGYKRKSCIKGSSWFPT